MTAAAVLAAARHRAGLTQRELAARADTSAAAICEYESGKRVPRVDTLERILSAAGARLDLEVRWETPPRIDVEANGRVLADLLDLVDHLPHRRDDDLTFPPFAAQAR
ncbi:MAG TPA: helix-turn-helix domain-containing protein [Acidimicrobiales bacterium]|nr:helix-turn-helix domain-containing protein [Acidimicrobiales bacterium]